MSRTSRRWLRNLPLDRMDAAEISGKFGRQFEFRSYSRFRFPDYDICKGPFRASGGGVMRFDLILANQVWEHLDRPYAATRHVLEMLKPGGYFWLAAPFFIPFHGAPVDNSRWSARGLANLLIEGGFEPQGVKAGQWGNRHAARRNTEKDWPPEYDEAKDDLANDPEYPICSWALARKSDAAD